jgi:hypothetical protein
VLCRRCEHRVWSTRLIPFWTSPARVWGASRLGDLICVRCGGVLPPERVTERLLGALSQLGQFGLAAAGRPLLRPDAEEDR